MRSTLTIPLLLLATLSTSAQPLTPTISPQLTEIHDIITRGASEVVAVASDGILLRSFDNGRSWGISRGPDTTAGKLYSDSAGTLFVATEQALYTEGPEENDWIVVHDQPIDRFVASPDGSYWMIEEESKRLYRQSPGGSGSWEPVPGILQKVRALEVAPDSTVWIAIGNQTYRSADGGPFERHGAGFRDEKRDGQLDSVSALLALRSGKVLATTRSAAWFSHRDSVTWSLQVYMNGWWVADAYEDRDGRIYLHAGSWPRVSEDELLTIPSLFGPGPYGAFNRVVQNDTFEFGCGGTRFSSGRYSGYIVRRSRGTSILTRHTWLTSYATSHSGFPWLGPIDSTRLFLVDASEYLLPLELRRSGDGEHCYWTTMRNGNVDRNFYPSIDSTVVYATRYHIIFSYDQGRTWDSIAAPPGRSLVQRLHPFGDQRYLVQTGLDSGRTGYMLSFVSIVDRTWTDHLPDTRDSGYLRTPVWKMADGTLIRYPIGAADRGLMVSRDTARTWYRGIDSLSHFSLIYAVVDGADGKSVALGADGRSWIDQGGTRPWRQGADTAAPGHHGIPHGFADSHDGVIYVSRSNGTIYRTEDNGDTWTEFVTLPTPKDIPGGISVSDHGKLYVATRFGYLYIVDIPTATSDVPVVRQVGRLDLW